MATTTNYGLTLLEQAQAQKEVTINEALGLIDTVLKGVVLDKDLAVPPGSPAAGAAYIVASGASGAWNAKVKCIAYYDQVWRFISPVTGMRVWVNDEQCYYQFNGTVWSASNPAITGNAATATALQTPRNINGVPFDGTADITISGGGGGNLTGEVTSVGTVTTVTNSAVIGKVLTGYVSGAGTVAATDTILQSIQKLNGNIALRATLASPTFTGVAAAPTASAGTNTTQLATTAFALANNFTLGTPITTTSGTAHPFTSVIPTTAKKVIMNFSGVSSNGSNAYLVQMGVGGSYATTGYNSGSTFFQSTTPYALPARYTAGFGIQNTNAATTFYGSYEFSLLNASTNIWCGQGAFMTSSGDYLYLQAGAVTLSGTLDSIRLTTVGGTDTFDAGTINIMWG